MTVQASKNFKGNIVRGMWIEQSLYNNGLGVIVATYNLDADDCETMAGGVMASGGGEVDIVYLNGKFSRRHPECLLRSGIQTGVIEGKELASEEKIAELLANHELYTRTEQAKKDAEDNAFNEAVEAMSVNPEYSHLANAERYCGAPTVAKNVRKHLKKHFPSHKFSVRSRGYDCIDVSWEDGAMATDVQKVVDEFTAGHFCGMEDIYKDGSSPFTHLFGKVKYMFTHRSFSDAVIEQTIAEVTKGDPLEGTITLEDYNRGGLISKVLQKSASVDDVGLVIGRALTSKSFYNKPEPKAKKSKATAQKAAVAQPTGTEVTNPYDLPLSQVQETIHTKKKSQIFVVSMVERLARETFLILKAQAKTLKGYYSSYTKDGAIAGFIFPDEESAMEFIKTAHA